MEGLQGPVVEALKEEKGAEDRSDTGGGATPMQVTAKSSTLLGAQIKQRFRNEV